jgi:hypothetical protein
MPVDVADELVRTRNGVSHLGSEFFVHASLYIV